MKTRPFVEDKEFCTAMTTERSGKSDAERGKTKNFQPNNMQSFMNLHCFLCLEAVLGD